MPRSVPRRALKETFDWTNRPASPWAERSSSQKARAKKPRSSSWRSMSRRWTPASSVGRKIMRTRKLPYGGGGRLDPLEVAPYDLELSHADRTRRGPGHHPLRREGDAAPRGDRVQAQALGRGRRQADPLAHHEALRPPRLHALRPLPRLQGEPDPRVLPQLPPLQLRLHDQARG